MSPGSGEESPLRDIVRSTSSLKIDDLIKNESDIIRILNQQEDLLMDNGRVRNVHHLVDEDNLLREEFDKVLKQFHGNEDNELKIKGNEEDIDDLFDEEDA